MTTQSAKPAISIDFKKSRIRIHKSTLHAIGDPEYILLLINPEERSIAIQRSSRSDLRAYHIIPAFLKGMKSCELSSLILIEGLFQIYDGWQNNQTYRIYGEAIHNEGIVKFHIDKAIPVNGIRVAP